MDPWVIGLGGMLVFFILALINIPLSFSFIATAFLGILVIKGIGPAFSTIGSELYSLTANFNFVCLPLFILMGQFAFHSGIGRDLFVAANKWLAKLPGGLALATMLACTGFAACNGSTVASAAAMGSLAFPEMERFKYDRGLSTAVIATGGSLGILIPPSNTFIIYGIVTQTSIAALFIAGILPGLMLSAMYIVLILVMCIRNPSLGVPGDPSTWKEKFLSLKGIWGMLFLFVLIIGGMYIGFFSPSEAGAIGSLGALILVAVKGQLKMPIINRCLLESARIACFVMFIVVGALIFNIFLSTSGFGPAFGQWMVSLGLPPWGILAFILFMYIPLGMFMDALAMVMLTLPIIFPVIVGLGFDPIWFGVLVTIMLEMGVLTPPIGLNVFVVQGVTNVPQYVIFRGLVPFIITMAVGLIILCFFPDISLFLPNLMNMAK
jgi:C4-dicarboxylate transporter DctM subunit